MAVLLTETHSHPASLDLVAAHLNLTEMWCFKAKGGALLHFWCAEESSPCLKYLYCDTSEVNPLQITGSINISLLFCFTLINNLKPVNQIFWICFPFTPKSDGSHYKALAVLLMQKNDWKEWFKIQIFTAGDIKLL